MSSDLDVVERLRTDPAPAMHVALADVLAEGRRRHTRRMASRLAIVVAGAAAAAVVAVVVLGPDDRGTTTPPVGTTTSTAKDLSISGEAGTELPDDHGSYSVVVDAGNLHAWVTRDLDKESSTVVLPSGAAWVKLPGTQDVPVLLGVVPAGATDIDLVPAPGTPSHTVQTVPSGDFEAFVVRFDEPLADGQLTGVDLQWRQGARTVVALGTDPQRVEFDVAGAGRLAVSMSSPRAGAVTATLDGAPLGPEPVVGDTPGTRYSVGKHALADGRVLVWGVIPQLSSVTPVTKPGASAGAAATRPLGEHPAYLAYAAIVDGSASDVTGIRTVDRSGAGIGQAE